MHRLYICSVHTKDAILLLPATAASPFADTIWRNILKRWKHGGKVGIWKNEEDMEEFKKDGREWKKMEEYEWKKNKMEDKRKKKMEEDGWWKTKKRMKEEDGGSLKQNENLRRW